MSDPRDDKLGDVDEQRQHPIPDSPPPQLDPDDFPVRYMACEQCPSRHMTEDAAGEYWVCPDCGATRPTVRGIIHETKAMVARATKPLPGLRPRGGPDA